jgi:hypothetical protein
VTIAQVNRIQHRLAAFQQAHADSQRLMQLFGITARITRGQLVRGNPKSGVKRMKAFWLRQGLTDQAWRYLHRLDAGRRNALFARLRYGLDAPRRDSQHARVVRDLGAVPNGRGGMGGDGAGQAAAKRAAAVRGWASMTSAVARQAPPRLPGLLLTLSPVFEVSGELLDTAVAMAFMDASVRRAVDVFAKDQAARTRYMEEQRDILDWLLWEARERRPAAADGDQDRAIGSSWKWFREQAQGWAEDRNRRLDAEAEERRLRRWDVPFTQLSIGSLTATCLDSQVALNEEADRMHHCVDTYGDACVAGEAVIVSLMREQERVGTLELRSGRGRWFAIQLRGVCNESLAEDPEANSAAAEVARLVGSWRPQPLPIPTALTAIEHRDPLKRDGGDVELAVVAHEGLCCSDASPQVRVRRVLAMGLSAVRRFGERVLAWMALAPTGLW